MTMPTANTLHSDGWLQIAHQLEDKELSTLLFVSKRFSELFSPEFIQERYRYATGCFFSDADHRKFFSQILRGRKMVLMKEHIYSTGLSLDVIGQFFRKLFSDTTKESAAIFKYRNQLIVQGVQKNLKKVIEEGTHIFPSTPVSRFGNLFAFCDREKQLVIREIDRNGSRLMVSFPLSRVPTQIALTSNRLIWGDEHQIWSLDYLQKDEKKRISPRPLLSAEEGGGGLENREFLLDGNLLYVVYGDKVDLYENGRKTHERVVLNSSSLSLMRLWRDRFLFFLDGEKLRCHDLIVGNEVLLPSKGEGVKDYFLFFEKLFYVDLRGNSYSWEWKSEEKPTRLLSHIRNIKGIDRGLLVMIRQLSMNEAYSVYMDPKTNSIIHTQPIGEFNSSYLDNNALVVANPGRVTTYTSSS